MSYNRRYQIEFNHCDPAGIVFYPRYFEITNSVVENFFADVVGHSFAKMHLDGMKTGVPTVNIQCDFIAPSRLGDLIDCTLEVEKLGGASMVVVITVRMGEETRLRARITLVWVDGQRPAPLPDTLRARITAFMETGK